MSEQKPLYEQFYRRSGIKAAAQLLKPTTWDISRFVFPKESVWVYTDPDYIAVAPAPNEYLLRAYDTKIFIEHLTELTPVIGKAIPSGIKAGPAVRAWQIKNKRFRLSHDISVQSGPMDAGYVLSAAMLGQTHRYPKSIYASYYKWYNVQATVFAKLKETTRASNKQYFLFVKLPQQLPSISRINSLMDAFNEQFITKMPTQEHWMFLELMKWISVKGRAGEHASLFSTFSPAALRHLNIVFQYGQRCFMVNMGVLDYFIGQGLSEADKQAWVPDYQFDQEPPFTGITKGKIDPNMGVRFFLRASMLLQGQDTGSESTDDGAEYADSQEPENGRDGQRKAPLPTEQKAEVQEASDSADQLQDMLDNLDADLGALEELEKQADVDEALSRSIDLDEPEEIQTQEDVSDEELAEQAKAKQEQLDKFEQAPLSSKSRDFGQPESEVRWRDFDKPLRPTESALKKIEALADAGLMDAAEYRRKVKAINDYAMLKAPGTDKFISDYVDIKPEELVLNEANTKIHDIETVPEKSMLQSTLKTFDEQYISNLMDRDVMAAIDGIQRGGVVVTGVDRETVEDVAGKYFIYSVRVTPVEGQPSTMRFKIPAVEADGSFKTGGTIYRLRKQRGD